ncbi:MAG TPA: hypothetical protein VN622_03355 [Clostridia bacterium]|nr:hypothetical protein [Clostridia bacterium]
MKKLFSRREPTENEVAETIEKFVAGTCGQWDWDDFISVTFKNGNVEAARVECLKVAEDFPGGASRWCSDDGLLRLLAIAASLRSASR